MQAKPSSLRTGSKAIGHALKGDGLPQRAKDTPQPVMSRLQRTAPCRLSCALLPPRRRCVKVFVRAPRSLRSTLPLEKPKPNQTTFKVLPCPPRRRGVNRPWGRILSGGVICPHDRNPAAVGVYRPYPPPRESRRSGGVSSAPVAEGTSPSACRANSAQPAGAGAAAVVGLSPSGRVGKMVRLWGECRAGYSPLKTAFALFSIASTKGFLSASRSVSARLCSFSRALSLSINFISMPPPLGRLIRNAEKVSPSAPGIKILVKHKPNGVRYAASGASESPGCPRLCLSHLVKLEIIS